MKPIVLYGAGKIGKLAFWTYKNVGREIAYFVDNDQNKWGTELFGVKIWGLSRLLQDKDKLTIVISAGHNASTEIIEILHNEGIHSFCNFDRRTILNLERIVSYSYKSEMEDVVLYHVLHDFDDIFYIDVGSNDPTFGSVTRLLYDTKKAHGINIDVLEECIELSKRERPRDINLCLALGKESGGKVTFYRQGGELGGLTSMMSENIKETNGLAFDVELDTLGNVCRNHILNEREIMFLKIDVEGAEGDVLAGADFEKYRPWIVVMESTEPCTDIPNYEKWESILFRNRYHFAYEHGINRYYVSDEKSELDTRFLPWEQIVSSYCILHAGVVNYDCI